MIVLVSREVRKVLERYIGAIFRFKQPLHPARIGKVSRRAEAIDGCDPADRFQRDVQNVEDDRADTKTHLPLLDLLVPEQGAEP